MRRILCVLLLLSLAAPAYAAKQTNLGDPDSGTGGKIVERADPDQPQDGYVNPWCAGCAAGFTWLCPGCGAMGPRGWVLGDFW